MEYINQYDYEHIPYPTNLKHPQSKLALEGTVSRAGCGLCCMAMVIGQLTTSSLSIEMCVEYAKASKANWEPGTDLEKLGQYVAGIYSLSYSATDDIDIAISHLKNGGGVIANVSGDQEDYKGIYSDVGHYLVILSEKDDYLTVIDSSLQPGKFEKEGRIGKVAVHGDFTVCHKSVMIDETSRKSPRYYLFGRMF